MFDRPRIIPSLLIDNKRLVKTIRFNNPNYLGDPINAVKIFNEKQADELCILDITRKKGNIDFNFLEDIATEAFMPLSYGGGVNNLEQVKKLFQIGFEKVIINTALYSNTELISQAVDYAGSQSIVASIDYKKTMFGKNLCFSECGSKNGHITPVEMAKRVEELGVGEILLNSIDRDGKMSGYDLAMINNISREVTVPVIACGGAGGLNDIKSVIDAGADAVAAGSIFVYYGAKKAVLINYPSEQELVTAGIFK